MAILEDVQQDFVFPDPPDPEEIEWPGTPIGLSNTITRTKGRTKVHNKSVDRTPDLLEALLDSAVRKQAEDTEAVHTRDVVIHGIRVRATTNSPHLLDFWLDNWYSPTEWERITGQTPPADPHIKVHAFGKVRDQKEAAYYSRSNNCIVFFNTAYYGQLKSWVLGAVGRVLAEEHGIHSIHGACVARNGRGVLYIAPTGTGKSTSSYGLMDYENTRFHSDDWVYVRYVYTLKDGTKVAPLTVTPPDGGVIRGYKVFRWIESHRDVDTAVLHGIGLRNEPIVAALGLVDFDKPLEAYAYTSEKIFYLRSNLVENFPLSAYQMLQTKFENVPDVSRRFIDTNRTIIEGILRDLINHPGEEESRYFNAMPRDQLAELVARMFAFDNSRAMLDISRVLPDERVFTNPMEPLKIAAVILLKRNREDPEVLESLEEHKFITRLMIGLTPEGKKETAYNAYRAVDDNEERAFIDRIEEASTGPFGIDEEEFYRSYLEAKDVPDTLVEEFELFRVMWQATKTYHMNTILQLDPSVASKREAVARTMKIILRTIDELPDRVHLDLTNYRDYIA
jgi:serine kinase of HPr protein (carbohydrate metabolism regulator)